MRELLRFAIEEDVFAVVFWTAVFLLAAGCLYMTDRVVKSHGDRWSRQLGAAWAWLRLRALLRFRRSGAGSYLTARWAVRRTDLDDWLCGLTVNEWARGEASDGGEGIR